MSRVVAAAAEAALVRAIDQRDEARRELAKARKAIEDVFVRLTTPDPEGAALGGYLMQCSSQRAGALGIVLYELFGPAEARLTTAGIEEAAALQVLLRWLVFGQRA